jgi:hypothetical protein
MIDRRKIFALACWATLLFALMIYGVLLIATVLSLGAGDLGDRCCVKISEHDGALIDKRHRRGERCSVVAEGDAAHHTTSFGDILTVGGSEHVGASQESDVTISLDDNLIGKGRSRANQHGDSEAIYHGKSPEGS